MADKTMRRWMRVGLQAAVIASVAAFLPTIDWLGVWAATREVSPWTAAAGALCALVNLFGKGSNVWLLLPPRARPRLQTLWGVQLRASAASIVMPFRAGEGLRIVWLRRLTGAPVAELLAIAVAEKVANLVSLAVLVAGAAVCTPLPAVWGPRAGAGLLAAVLALGVALGLGYGLRRRLGAAGEALAGLADRGVAVWAGVGACALLGWLGDCSLVWLMARATGTHVPWVGTPLVLLAINLAIALPGTPGHVGTMELAAGTALSAFGAERDAALGFAILYHAVQLVTVLALAAVHLLADRVAHATTSRAAAAPPTAQPPGR